MNSFESEERRIFGEGKCDQLPVASSFPLLFPFFLANKWFRLAISSQKFLNYYRRRRNSSRLRDKVPDIIVFPFVSCIQVSWIYRVSDNRE